MTPRKVLAGTDEHRTALYRAACAYQDGLSLEAAARQHRVQPNTLRAYMQRSGWVIHTNRYYRGRASCNEIPDEFLDAHPRLTPRQIADACGVAVRTVRRRLRERGNYQPRAVGAQPAARWANSLRNKPLVLEAVAMRSRGCTQGQIAIRLGVPRSTVNSWLQRYAAGDHLWQREPIPEWARLTS